MREWHLRADGVKVPIPYVCECGVPAVYGERDYNYENEWIWYCSPCWQRGSEMQNIMAQMIREEIDASIVETIKNVR